MAVLMDDSASGFRPNASTAFDAMLPIERAGAIAPTPIVNAIAIILTDSAFIVCIHPL